MADLDLKAEAETLDRIDVVYQVQLSLCITAGVYSGPLDNEKLAALINERGIHADDIDDGKIIEVRLDDHVIGRSVGNA